MMSTKINRRNPFTVNDLHRSGRRNRLTLNDLEYFHPPVASRLGDDGIPSTLSLLVGKGSCGVFINEFIHY